MSNNNKYVSVARYIQCRPCGLGNKMLGLISSIAYCVSFFCSLKVKEWKSLWWYFSFPLYEDNKKYKYNYTFSGHFYAIVDVIENKKTCDYLLKKGVIIYNKNKNVMINYFAYSISFLFLKIKTYVKSNALFSLNKRITYGIHARTGKADGNDFTHVYLKLDDLIDIFRYIKKKINSSASIYLSSDSIDVKFKYFKNINNIMFSNTSSCNSRYGLLIKNNSCAIEAINDYYILSRCNHLLLTKCSTFSLISLFSNKIGYSSKRLYKYFGKCKSHFDLYN